MGTILKTEGKKSLFIKTFGCQMNEYDSEKMVMLLANEYKRVENPEDADLILDISNEINGREILAYNSNGQVSAYRLTIRVTFRAYDVAGGDIVPDSEIYITRDMDFSNTTVLATDVQQQQFLTLMRKDMALQILRRISTAAKNPQARSF